MEFAKRVLFSDGGLTNNLFKIDETFNNFYYVDYLYLPLRIEIFTSYCIYNHRYILIQVVFTR